MVDWDVTRERLRAYRRNVANTWGLFKESRIGVVGIGIMIVFVVLAALAPALGLRDPIEWRAPSEDVISLQTFWQTDTSTFQFDYAGGPIRSQAALRVTPRATNPTADRIYVASGDKLLAINPVTGTRGWNRAFPTPANITAGPVAVNYGSKINPDYLDLVVYVGTADGTLYALNDSEPAGIGGESGTPGGSDVVTRSVGGRITSIAAWSEPTDDPASPAKPARNPGESVFVGTSDGHLFAFAASNLSLTWEWTFGVNVSIRMAAGPMNPPTNPSYSPALTEDGQRLFVNAGDWWSLYTRNGTLAWTDPFAVSSPWSSPPVVALPSTLADGDFGELVYAASDDGWLFARKATTGAPYGPWESSSAAQLHPSGIRTIPVMQTASQRDAGPLASPFIDSTTVYVTSNSGILYSIARDAVGTISAGTVKWRFADKVLVERGFRFSAAPVMAIAQRILFGIGVDSRGTPDVSDDQGVLYSLSEVGGLLWRRDFNATLEAPPSIWTTQAGSQFNIPSVWLGTGRGWVYSISSTGTYLAPLPPGTYPSGNTYLLGTDSQGRDILSQFIWGSRIALIVGFASALLSVTIGLVVGLVAGYLGQKTDIVLMRFTDVILVLPTLPLLIILSAVLGSSIWNIILVIALLAWPSTARVIRSQILSLKERPYIQSARVTGASGVRIMFRHLTPNVLPLVFLYMTFAVSGAILFEAALSFIGLGDPSTPSWGQMLSTVQQADLLRAYWWLLPPGLGITVLSLAFFLTGRAFEQIINPRLRTR
ncbi:MAG TPA: ABC transporter permease subunit [Thermoplasmata archaeon]|nr:ABC transporter permease subunit [Thermoplasmata archaeon]